MSLKRTTAFLIALGLALGWAGPTSADIGDMQLFAPVRLNSFNTTNGTRTASTGAFFSFDSLMWYVQQPDRALVGADGSAFIFSNRIDYPVPDTFPPEFVPPYTTPAAGAPVPYFELVGFNQHSTADTGGLTSGLQYGQRYEMGWMGDHAGLMVSAFHVNRRSQTLDLGTGSVLFQDPGDPDPLLSGVIFGTYVYGYVPLIDPFDPNDDWGDTLTVDRPIDIFYGTLFEDLKLTYKLRNFWGIELDYIRRTNQLHHGGYMELFLGARYIEFDDQMLVLGSNPQTDVTTEYAMKDYTLVTDAENHIFGLQLGLRYFKQHQQWMFNAEGKFMAGLNSQNIHQESSFNSNDVLYWPGWKSAQNAFFQEFTPMVELRMELAYQATDAIRLKVGWTGMWMDGLCRSPSVPQYIIPDTGILGSANRQDVLTHGLTLGIDINR